MQIWSKVIPCGQTSRWKGNLLHLWSEWKGNNKFTSRHEEFRCQPNLRWASRAPTSTQGPSLIGTARPRLNAVVALLWACSQQLRGPARIWIEDGLLRVWWTMNFYHMAHLKIFRRAQNLKFCNCIAVLILQIFSAKELTERVTKIRDVLSDPNLDWTKRVEVVSTVYAYHSHC